MPMTTANKLTIARVLMIPVFLVILYWGFPGSSYVALAVYIIACLTDLADGYIARHYNQVSDFGKFMDPLADKCLVMAALCWFVENGDMVGWVLAHWLNLVCQAVILVTTVYSGVEYFVKNWDVFREN